MKSKIIAKIKNWWNPLGYKHEEVIDDYEFEPKEDITAYELYLCKTKPFFYNKSLEGFKIELNDWYNKLPEKCKRHIIQTKQKYIEYRQYE